MHSEWRTTTSTLQGQTCLRHTVTKELTAFGTSGLLYEIKPGEIAAIRYINGDEVMTRGITPKQVKTWVTRLGIPSSGEQQQKLV